MSYDHLQMGGQDNIIANIMAVCGVQKVYAHAASLASDQIKMFVDEPNLLLANSKNQFVPARKAVRVDDKSLIHWILEFKKGDQVIFNGKMITCPKSNRFIATYDPLNFELAVDKHFNEATSHLESGTLQYIVLSGYQLLQSKLPNGTEAIEVIRDSWKKIGFWKKRQSLPQVHPI
jgi:ADP-dependent phosphofructokinase/glucokinase